MDSQLLNLENDTKDANQVKDLVLARLVKDKLITNKQAAEYAEKHQIIIIKAGWFTRWCEKFGFKEESYKFKYVKFED